MDDDEENEFERFRNDKEEEYQSFDLNITFTISDEFGKVTTSKLQVKKSLEELNSDSQEQEDRIAFLRFKDPVGVTPPLKKIKISPTRIQNQRTTRCARKISKKVKNLEKEDYYVCFVYISKTTGHVGGYRSTCFDKYVRVDDNLLDDGIEKIKKKIEEKVNKI